MTVPRTTPYHGPFKMHKVAKKRQRHYWRVRPFTTIIVPETHLRQPIYSFVWNSKRRLQEIRGRMPGRVPGGGVIGRSKPRASAPPDSTVASERLGAASHAPAICEYKPRFAYRRHSAP